MAAAGTVPVSVPELKTVVMEEAPTKIVDPLTKPLPDTVMGKAAVPAVREEGFKEVMAGLTRKLAALELTGLGLVTTMVYSPVLASRAAGKGTLNAFAAELVTLRVWAAAGWAAGIKLTTEPLTATSATMAGATKPLPETMREKVELPAAAGDWLRPVICGTGTTYTVWVTDTRMAHASVAVK